MNGHKQTFSPFRYVCICRHILYTARNSLNFNLLSPQGSCHSPESGKLTGCFSSPTSHPSLCLPSSSFKEKAVWGGIFCSRWIEWMLDASNSAYDLLFKKKEREPDYHIWKVFKVSAQNPVNADMGPPGTRLYEGAWNYSLELLRCHFCSAGAN